MENMPRPLRNTSGRVDTAYKSWRSGKRHSTKSHFTMAKSLELKSSDENRQLQDIVITVLKKINLPLKVADHPVGMEEIVEDFRMSTTQFDEGVEDVQIIGIWGMGGSGKTTLAKELYNRRSPSFGWSSFVYDVRYVSSKGMLCDLQKKILHDFHIEDLKFNNIEEGKETLLKHLRSVKALIVLDDVDHVSQVDALLPAKDCLAEGSFIIITTRDYGVLRSCGITSIYKIKALKQFYAQQLLCWYAFKQSSPHNGFEELVEKLLEACSGLPLALKVIGAQLYGESSKEYWESLLHKIIRILPIDIQNILKISYDVLDDEEKEMFLDAACFFIGEKYTLPIEVWNGLGLSGLHAWKRLLNKCLVECDDYNYVKMHDHLRDLGRSIAIKQLPYRFWLRQPNIIPIQNQEAFHSGGFSFWGLAASFCPCLMSVITAASHNKLQNRIGIHGIIATTDRVEWNTYAGRDTVIPEMAGGSGEVDSRVWCSDGQVKVKTNRGIWSIFPSSVELKYLVIRGESFSQVMGEVSGELVWLRWFEIGQRSLPSRLFLKKLKILELYEPKWGQEHYLEELWGETDCEVPVLLRELIISHCNEFQGFPKSIRYLNHLKKILIISHNNVTSLPDEFCFLPSLEHLVLEEAKMQSLPTNFGNLSKLRYLSFYQCGELRRLPISFKKLMYLEYLNLSCCSQLTFMPEDLNILENITKLEIFNFSQSQRVEELPRHIGNNVYLRELDLSGTSLRRLPDNIGKLSRLGWFKIANVLSTSLPTSLGGLSSLTNLVISDCPYLECLPDSIGSLSSLTSLYIQFCPELERVPDSFGDLSSLVDLVIEICPKLDGEGVKSLQKAARKLSNLQRLSINRSPISGSSLSFSSSNLKDIEVRDTEVRLISFSEDCSAEMERLHIWENHCLEEIESLPRTLESISLRNCEKLKSIPSLAQLISLRAFVLSGCSKIEKIEGIPRTLESISLGDCEELKSIPSFANSTSLRKFVLYGCCKIQNIEGIENCTRLKKLTVESCWEMPGIKSLEHLQNLKRLVLRANKGSIIEHCIQTIQKWPDAEITICAQAVTEAALLVDYLLSSNLVIVDSISNRKIKSRPKLVKNGSSNGDAFMLCLVTNCLTVSQKTLHLGDPWDRPFSIQLKKGRWAWVGVFTERSGEDFLRAGKLSIFEYGECGEDEVEKGLIVRGEEQALMEALRSIMPLFQR